MVAKCAQEDEISVTYRATMFGTRSFSHSGGITLRVETVEYEDILKSAKLVLKLFDEKGIDERTAEMAFLYLFASIMKDEPEEKWDEMIAIFSRSVKGFARYLKGE